jgi:hypothetical protein
LTWSDGSSFTNRGNCPYLCIGESSSFGVPLAAAFGYAIGNSKGGDLLYSDWASRPGSVVRETRHFSKVAPATIGASGPEAIHHPTSFDT